MFSKIVIPVDLQHTEQVDKALQVAADYATRFGAEVHMVGVTMSSPTEIARTPEIFSSKLAAFAEDQGQRLGVSIVPHAEISHDMRIDLDQKLQEVAAKIGADLIVMASHVPGFAEHIFASNAGYLAAHASMSVFVVR